MNFRITVSAAFVFSFFINTTNSMDFSEGSLPEDMKNNIIYTVRGDDRKNLKLTCNHWKILIEQYQPTTSCHFLNIDFAHSMFFHSPNYFCIFEINKRNNNAIEETSVIIINPDNFDVNKVILEGDYLRPTAICTYPMGIIVAPFTYCGNSGAGWLEFLQVSSSSIVPSNRKYPLDGSNAYSSIAYNNKNILVQYGNCWAETSTISLYPIKEDKEKLDYSTNSYSGSNIQCFGNNFLIQERGGFYLIRYNDEKIIKEEKEIYKVTHESGLGFDYCSDIRTDTIVVTGRIVTKRGCYWESVSSEYCTLIKDISKDKQTRVENFFSLEPGYKITGMLLKNHYFFSIASSENKFREHDNGIFTIFDLKKNKIVEDKKYVFSLLEMYHVGDYLFVPTGHEHIYKNMAQEVFSTIESAISESKCPFKISYKRKNILAIDISDYL